MAKLTILVFILGLGATLNGVIADTFMADLQELDELMFTSAMDIDRPGKLPQTPDAIYESWCRPMLHNTMRQMDLIERLFPDNPLLLIITRVCSMAQLNMGSKFCDNPQAVNIMAKFNGPVSRFIPRIIPWYKMSINTYLAAAHPDSQVDTGELICLAKKMGLQLLLTIPPKIRKGIIAALMELHQTQAHLVVVILKHMNVDLLDDDCRLVQRRVPNPFGIRSQEVAALLAWDKALRELSG